MKPSRRPSDMFFRRKRKTTASFGIPSAWPRRNVTPRRSLRKTLHRPSSNTKFSNNPTQTNASATLGRKLKKITLLGITLGVVGWTSYFLLLSDKLTVETTQVQEDDQIVSNHPLEDLLKKFKGANLLLIKTDDLEAYLKQRYTQYESIALIKDFPGTLTLSLKNYAIVANLTTKNIQGEEKNWLLNSHGNLVQGKQKSELPLIKIETETPITEGLDVVSQEHLAFMLEAMQNFEDKFGMKVPHTLYLANEREAHLWTEREFYVWLDMTIPLDEQLNKLKRALSEELNIYKDSLEYIDLRIIGVNGEKLIVKRKP